jgi:hypothetical protein|nr:MAG TPA: hypothetical protein [Caudoviricetes sp.]
MELPDDLIKTFSSIEKNTDKMLGEMTKAGAEVVVDIVKANLPEGLKDLPSSNITLTKTYKTPSDDGINTKVVISGYFTNKNGKRTPAPLVANMFEYGSSKREYPKQPFFRKSFRKAQIEKAMLDVQDKYLK